MKCHYEVLDLALTADNTEIKSAYRKLALKWHPDKNLDSPQHAKEQFQIVQQAYEVLSDRQERAWYDAHRDEILRGRAGSSDVNSLDLFQYFTTSCFKGYSNDEGGFYAVYRKVFEDLAKEDMEFMEKEEFTKIPTFGYTDSDLENVKIFYDYWMSYSTKKTFSWLDPYDIHEGKGDKRLMKMIDKENKKVRVKARKERNEEIRNLVGFVRKRDKRVQAIKKELEAKALANQQKQAEISKKQRLERKELVANQKQADWMKFDNVKDELEAIEEQLKKEFSDDDEDIDNLYCVACNKLFKTPKAFENHESSKKHKENVRKLKQSILDDDELSEDFNEEIIEDVEIDALIETVCSAPEEVSYSDDEKINTKKSKKKKKNKKKQQVVVVDELELKVDVISDDSDFDFSAPKSKKKLKKAQKVRQPTEEVNSKVKKVKQPITEDIDLSLTCAKCKSLFPSKNKLFQHLEKTKHGVYLGKK